MRKASAIELDDAQREKLVKLAHSNTTEVRLARRASIVLLAADGLDNHRIGEIARRWPDSSGTLARALRGGRIEGHRAGFAARRAQAQDRPGGDRAPDHADQAGGCDPVEYPDAGGGGWGERHHDPAHLDGAGLEAAPGQALQGIARSQVCREARRHRRSVHVPARARAGAVLRREEPGAGTRSHPAGSADEARPCRHHDPRLQAQRHHHAVCRDEYPRRHGHLALRAAPSSCRVARLPAPDQPRNAAGQDACI